MVQESKHSRAIHVYLEPVPLSPYYSHSVGNWKLSMNAFLTVEVQGSKANMNHIKHYLESETSKQA